MVMMKRKICLLMAIVLLAVSLGALASCSSRAPELSEIYDRVVELIEASYGLNEVFYGAGLPYYDRELEVYAPLYSDIATQQYTRDYNVVSDLAMYRSVDEIKMAAEQVYSRELLEDVVYPSAFTGLVLSGAASGAEFVHARYLEGEDQLYIYAGDDHTLSAPTPLVYDYATMEIIRPSNAERVLVRMTAWEQDAPETLMETTLTLTLSESGVWLLDSLTV